MKKSPSKIKLRAGERIGEMAAEDDAEYLAACFVEMPIIVQLKDTKSPVRLLLGRTGSGKSAVFWHLEHTCSNVSRLVPKEASFSFVANSTIIARLTDLGVNLSVFYEYLWKHMLCIHVIRECLGVKTEDHFGNLLRRLKSFVTRD
jgi:hypothetical protein